MSVVRGSRKWSRPWWNVLGLLVLLLAAQPTAEAYGQQSHSISWTEERVMAKIYRVRSQTFFPVVAADNFGNVHIFWTEGQTIFYTRKDQSGWSAPIDVVWQAGRSIQFPQVAIDKNQTIHLVWEAFGDLYHKSVPAWESTNLHNWSKDQLITHIGGTGTAFHIAIDSQNTLHLVVADWYGTAETVAGNVYHYQSSDGGESWSDGVQVSSVPDGDLATDPRMAFDAQGRVHIAWAQMSPELDGLQQGVYYARIAKNGSEVMSPVEIDQHQPGEKWMMGINIGVVNENEIHAIWVCGTVAKRCHASSTDGGQSWSAPEGVFNDLIGLSGWDAMFTDSAGTLYWMGVLRYPQAMYYSYWDGAHWVDPPIIGSTDTYMQLGENVMVATALGNQTHAVIQLGETIAYMSGVTSAAGETAADIAAFSLANQPTATVQPTEEPVQDSASDGTVRPANLLPPAKTTSRFLQANSAANMLIFSISFGAAALVVVLAASIHFLRKR